MAKYVGKIFKVNNAALKIKRNGAHYVHVQWFNPFTKRFRCKIITTLEDKRELRGDDKRVLGKGPFHYENGDVYSVFSKGKYERLRNGDIVPIPISKTKGFGVWTGYEHTRYIHISVLKGKEQKHLSIKK